MGTSQTTGDSFYSGDWTDVKNVVRVLNIGDGKMAVVNKELVEKYQEMVDRFIDGILGELYRTPLIARNQIQPNGVTKAVFPGAVTRAATYWTAGLLLSSEFQGLDPNTNESANAYVEDARKQIYSLRRFNERLQGQDYRSHFGRTMLPNMQPPALPETDY